MNIKKEQKRLNASQLIKEGILEIGDGYRAKNSEMGNSGLPFARAGNLNNGFNFDDADILSIGSVAKAGSKLSRPGDVAFTSKGTFGRFAYVNQHTPKFVYSPQLCYWRVKNPKIINPRFLFYWMQSDDCMNQMHQIKGLTDMADYVSLSNQRRMWVSVPKMEEQKCIATILSAYDDLIENNTRRIKILEEIAQTLYREWFVNFRFPGHEKVQMVDSPLGKIPEGWEFIVYSDLLESNTGGDWGEEEPNKKENCPVAVIRGTDFEDVRHGNNLRLPRRYISRSSLIKRRLQENDILIENSVNAKTRCTGQSLLITRGILNRIGFDSICASFCKVFRLKKPELSPIAHLNLKYLYSEGRMEYYRHTATNGIGNFQATRFLESEYIVLPKDTNMLSEMCKILSCLTQSTLVDQIDNLRHTRDLLLPKLISGEVNVDIIGIMTEGMSA